MIGQFVFSVFCMVGFALGLRIVTSEGQLLYFLRRPVENMDSNVEVLDDLYKNCRMPNVYRRLLIAKAKFYIFKPIIYCITCFASVWGVTVYGALNGLTVATLPHLAIACLSAAFIQTFIWSLYVRYVQ